MNRPLHILCLCLLPLAACTQFPQLDRSVPPELETAGYPALVPLPPLLARVQTQGVDRRAVEARLEGRLARLRARAARLRGSVLSGRERQRLREGMQ